MDLLEACTDRTFVESSKSMRRLFVAVVFCVLNCSLINAADSNAENGRDPGICKARKDLAGGCIKVRGRLRTYGTFPHCRIWPVGSTHLLGVAEPKTLPANVACGDGFEVFADFIVCPVTGPKPSGMQMVCVASAGNLRASELKSESAH